MNFKLQSLRCLLLAAVVLSHVSIAVGQELQTVELSEAVQQVDPYRRDRASSVFGLFNLGVAFGGDRLATVQLYDAFGNQDERSEIRAGEGVAASIGGGWKLRGRPVSLQATIGVHVDGVSDGGDEHVDFSYLPVDLSAHLHQGRHRFGAGLRIGFSPALDLEDAAGGRVEYSTAFGAFAQYEYLFSRVSLAVRGTWLDLSVKRVSDDFGNYAASSVDGVDASHVALFLNVPF